LFQADLSKENEIRDLIPHVLQSCPDLKGLIHSASIYEQAPFKDTSFDLYNHHLNLNLKAPFFLSQGFVLAVKSGFIITILDSQISHHSRKNSAYQTSKAALEYLTEHLALQLAPQFRVNGIAPGAILSPPGTENSYVEKVGKNTPMKRHGTIQDIAKACDYLLNAPYANGQILQVDGGSHLS